MNPPRVLLTRPLTDSAALAARLAAAGWDPVVWPLLEIRPTGMLPDFTGAQAVLLTSANAVRAVPAPRLDPDHRPCLCVGPATATAAREAGYGAVIEASGDGESLARLARERLSPGAGPLLFLRGAEVAADLAAMLAADGFDVRETIVYEAVAAKSVPQEVAALMNGGAFTAALFFSPRSARIFAALAAPWHAALRKTVAVAISARAASPLADSGFAAVVVAASPDEGAMLSALGAASRDLVQAAAPRYDSLNRKEAKP